MVLQPKSLKTKPNNKMSFLKQKAFPVYNNLTGIFEGQEKLMKLYQPISKPQLPDWPMDLGNRDNQRILKSFMGDVIEEIGEYYEHTLTALGLLISEDPDSIKQLSIKQAEMNEELADVLHFLVEVFIFVNITEQSFAKYFYKELKTMNVGEKFTNHDMDEMNILDAGLFLAKLTNNLEFNHQPSSIALDKPGKFDYEGCKYLSPKMIPNISKLCWYITYNLTLAKSTLKNKAWKQTDVDTNVNKLQRSLMGSFCDLLRLMDYLNFESKDICQIYFRKNLENQLRIKSKY